MAARKTIRREAVLPGDAFHRPFLFMLTREGSELDQVRLPPPVDSRKSVVHKKGYYSALASEDINGDYYYARSEDRYRYSPPTSERSYSGRFLTWLVIVAVFAGISNGVIRNFNRQNQKPKPVVPKMTIDTDNERTMEALRVLVGGEEGRREVQKLKERAGSKQDFRSTDFPDSLLFPGS